MKRILITFTIGLIVALLVNPASAQTSNKEMRKALKFRPTKEIKKQAKDYTKQGYYVAVGAPSIERQLTEGLLKERQENETGYPKYIVASAQSVGETQIAAKLQAVEAAKLELAGTIASNIAGLVENNIGNSQLNTEEATSVTQVIAASKNIIAPKVGRITTLSEMYRNLENKNIEASSATLNGTVYAQNLQTTISFEYGTTTSYGQTIAATPNPVTGNSPTPVSAALINLTPGTTCHFRAKAVNSGGISAGGVKQFITPESGTSSPIEWVFVQGGTFQMGSNDGDSDELPIHSVTLSNFYISKYEATHKQYIEFLNAINCNNNGSFNDSEFGSAEYIDMDDTGCAIGYTGGSFYFKGSSNATEEDCPVIEVTWYGANAFCKWAGGRLPTEAEWEFAARGGTQSKGYTYSGSNTIGNVAWYVENSGSQTHPVGLKQANELGVYDMSGNVWEWCSDWYGSYSSSSQANPAGPASGSDRVPRGGGWHNDADRCRVATRSKGPPGLGGDADGFRVARSSN